MKTTTIIQIGLIFTLAFLVQTAGTVRAGAPSTSLIPSQSGNADGTNGAVAQYAVSTTPTLRPTTTATGSYQSSRVYLSLVLKNHPPVYAVSGQVTDDTGAPIVGATVSANGPVNMSAATEGNGRYAFHLPAGTYSIGVSKAGYISPPPRNVTVPPHASNVDFVLQPPSSGDHNLRDISCHLFFWWRDDTYDFPNLEYRVYHVCTPPGSMSGRVENPQYNRHGLKTGWDSVYTFDETGDTIIKRVRDGQYDSVGRTTGYRADLMGSYFDAFRQAVSYSYPPEYDPQWSNATIIKAYSNTESYRVEITPCWDGTFLVGYRTAVYGGTYNGEGMTIGGCP